MRQNGRGADRQAEVGIPIVILIGILWPYLQWRQ